MSKFAKFELISHVADAVAAATATYLGATAETVALFTVTAFCGEWGDRHLFPETINIVSERPLRAEG